VTRKFHLVLAAAAIVAMAGRPFQPGPRGPEHQVYLAKYAERSDGRRDLIFSGYVPRRSDNLRGGTREARYPRTIFEDQTFSSEDIVEIVGPDAEVVRAKLRARNVLGSAETASPSPSPLQDDARTLIRNGPSSSRIDLVFLGDGYTLAEKWKFFSDILTLVREMFGPSAFASYLPIFNVHAVFRPSEESGVGRGKPKKTAYGLYRLGETLRSILPTNYKAARESAAAAPDCDYPIIIANDPYYGGSGGEFAISTSSATSGTAVLRHELGHTIGKVGEEYDGGVYFGANFSPTLAVLPWTRWLTNPSALRPEPMADLYIGWPWHKLANGPFRADFLSPGGYSRRTIFYSVSGFGNPADSLTIDLDGISLPFTPPGHSDRVFNGVSLEGGFSPGSHTIRFAEGHADGDNWLCSLNIYEYGWDFHAEEGYIGAYPVFSTPDRLEGFRPTNESCLLRNMNYPLFCPVCRENLWLKMLEKISLIDDVDVVYGPSSKISVTLNVPWLGQFRPAAEAINGERLEIRWFQEGAEVISLRGKTVWAGSSHDSAGAWRVEVRFIIPEVRSDPADVLLHRYLFRISPKGGPRLSEGWS
jgi:hypothetical protein